MDWLFPLHVKEIIISTTKKNYANRNNIKNKEQSERTNRAERIKRGRTSMSKKEQGG